MTNKCQFSADRAYRYSLLHRWDELVTERKRVMWCGLNPSTADESELDPTLRRILRFSCDWGFNEFVMTNLFAFRSTQPKGMLLHHDPVGPENDRWLLTSATSSSLIIACWGAHGFHLGRDVAVQLLLRKIDAPLFCLGITEGGFPRHPLYVPSAQKPIRFSP